MAVGYTRATTPPLLLLALALGAGCSSTSEGPTNHAPTVQISLPAGALTVPESSAVIFKGSGTDAEDGTLANAALSWSSSRDGALGTGDSIRVATLTVGNHVVTLTGEDSKGLTGTATVAVTVTPFVPGNQPPQVSIAAPASGTAVTAGTKVVFTGSANDPEDGALMGAALTWSSSLDGALGTGVSISDSTLTVGLHTITLRAADDSGAHTDATITITVNPAPVPLGLDTVVTGLTGLPLFLTAPPGDLTRLFVVEKAGTIRIIKNGALLATPFLDLSALVTTVSEQGLLGLAFSPDYATSGRFYVSYTTTGGGAAGHSVVARYHVSGNADIASTTDTVIITADQPYSNHNGGNIIFGPDGFLYFGLGDGGSGGDPDGHGQDRTELLGSMLRIDVSGATYTIPAGNPFAASGTDRHELWNYGLRNPWRWSFDRQTGDLYIADVGQGQHEEVDVQPATSTGGENYGWNIMEGFSCYPTGPCDQTGLTLPVIDYPHTGGACSITGGYVYRGSAIPALQGHYLYADYCAGWVKSLRWVGGAATEQQDRPSISPGSGITSFGEDQAGELYILRENGTIYRIVAR